MSGQRFPGQYFDQETGLHYNYFRDYDPGTGRYIQSDPIGLGGGLNTYSYALNNPLYWADPTGECAGVCTGIGVGLSVAGRALFSYSTRSAAVGATAWGASNVWGDGASDHPSHADENDALATPLSATCEELEWAISALQAAISWRKQDIRRHGWNNPAASGHRIRIKMLQDKLDKLQREYNLRCKESCDIQ